MRCVVFFFFFFSSRRRHTRFDCDWSSDVCSSDLLEVEDSIRVVGEAGDGGEAVERVPQAAVDVLLLDIRMPRKSGIEVLDRKSTRLNSSHSQISYAVFCLKKKKNTRPAERAK